MRYTKEQREWVWSDDCRCMVFVIPGRACNYAAEHGQMGNFTQRDRAGAVKEEVRAYLVKHKRAGTAQIMQDLGRTRASVLGVVLNSPKVFRVVDWYRESGQPSRIWGLW